MTLVSITTITGQEFAPILHAIDGGSASNWSERSYASHLSNGTTLAAIQDEAVIGFVAAIVTEEFVEIVNVCVAEQERKKGYASTLLEALFAQYPDREFFLEARESNIPALQLYQKVGFIAYHVRKSYYADGENAVQLRKPSA